MRQEVCRFDCLLAYVCFKLGDVGHGGEVRVAALDRQEEGDTRKKHQVGHGLNGQKIAVA
jgi:hypothetical protein